MAVIKANLKTWPRRKNGEPIFRTANDAIFYAQLALRDQSSIDIMKAYREKAHRDLRNERQKASSNPNRLMEFAVKAQFFRECWEEIERILAEEKK